MKEIKELEEILKRYSEESTEHIEIRFNKEDNEFDVSDWLHIGSHSDLFEAINNYIKSVKNNITFIGEK